MAALVALDEVKAKYGNMMSAAEYKKRKKAILASFSGQMFASAGPGYKARARFIWRDVQGMTNVKGKDFKEVRAKMKGDFKSDPDCTGRECSRTSSPTASASLRGVLPSLMAKSGATAWSCSTLETFVSSLPLTSLLWTLMRKTTTTKKMVRRKIRMRTRRRQRLRQRAASAKGAPEKPLPEAEEEAGSSTGGRPQRARKQPAK